MGLPSRGRVELDSAARLAALGRRGGDHLDIRPRPQVIIDDLAARGKALDSKWNRRKCNPNRECRSRNGLEREIRFRPGRLAESRPDENNVHASFDPTGDDVGHFSGV
jgi:hypothetical protein